MTNISTPFKASKVVFDCGNELYHLECARRKYGDEDILNNLRHFYTEEEGLSPSNASIRAGQFLNDIDRLKTKEFNFKQMRANKAINNFENTITV